MKRSAKEFRNYVSELRRMTPYYNNNRRVVVLSEETKAGQRIIEMASRYIGKTLSDVYTHWSSGKQDAFNEVYSMFEHSRHGTAFGICSKTCNFFTVSWVSDDGVHFITKDSEYLVILNE